MKRYIKIILLLVCLAFGSVQAKILGDFNNDGHLSIADAIMFIRHLMGLEVIPEVGQEIPEPGGVYLLYRDILGNAEFEADGDYPPPEDLDDYYDGEITVTLRFADPLDIFETNEVYGYMITVDYNPVNYHFKFIPNGKYWLEAEFVIQDSCFYDKSEVFQHSDSVDTVVELHPGFLGLNLDCFDLILTGVSEQECVRVGERMWVTGKVYERFYKDADNYRDLQTGKKDGDNFIRPLKRKRKIGG